MTATDERAAETVPRTATRRWLSGRPEWVLAAFGSILLSVAMTWPAMRRPTSTLPGDFWDTSLQAWQVAWSGWAVRHDPGRLWESNAHFGEQWAFAYSDSLLGYLPAGLIGSGPTAAILRYNILYVLVFALAFFGAYVLARQLGSNRSGALLAGVAFAYAPLRWTHVMHLNLLSTGGIALGLAMLARGHGYSLRRGYRPELARPGWALAGWLVAAWQVTLGFGIGLAYGYLLALLGIVSVAVWIRRRPRFGRRLFTFDAIGVVVFVAVAGAMAYPYLKVTEAYPYAKRGFEEILFYSPGFLGFFTAPSHEWLWGTRNLQQRIDLIPQGGWEALILPGFGVMAVAALGLFVSVWPWRHRVLMALAIVVVGLLAMGLRSPLPTLYYQLFDYLPGWNAIRVPARLVLWVLLFLCVLAAGAVTAVAERARSWKITGLRPVLALALLLPAAFAVLEGVQIAPVPTVPKTPAGFDTVAAPVLVLPSNDKDDELVMLWSTSDFKTVVNGSSGFIPATHTQMREKLGTFPDADTVAYLRARGVRTVLAEKRPIGVQTVNPPWAEMKDTPPSVFTAPVDQLGITRTETADLIIFVL